MFSSKYFLTPPPLKTPLSKMMQPPIKCSSYSPASCNVTNYDFTFIYDDNEKAFKVHGLWPEQCGECLACGYPSCCDASNMSYIFPSDPGQIAFLNARWFNATTREECFNKRIEYKRIEHKRIGNKRIGNKRIGNKRIEHKRIGHKRIGNENNDDEVSLFEHEFFKHASCTPFRQNTSRFVEQVMRLYDEYYATHVENRCAGYNQLWLNLDGNFAYNNITKCI